MKLTAGKAELFVDGQDVGTVRVRGWTGSWGFGEFEPNERFAGMWLLFGQCDVPLSPEEAAQLGLPPAQGLRRAEVTLEAGRARLFVEAEQAWHEVSQINLEGNTIEWKETGAA